MRPLIISVLLAIIAASAYSAWKWGTEDEPETPENDAQVRERLAVQRRASRP